MKKVPGSIKEVFNNAIEELLIEFLEHDIEFSIIISNKNWDFPIPDRLLAQDYFLIQIKEQSLIDSYYDGESIIISTEFDNVPNSKTIYPEDIQGILGIDMKTVIIQKNYQDTPRSILIEKARELSNNPLLNFTEEELIQYKDNIEKMIKNNPEMFNKEAENV